MYGGDELIDLLKKVMFYLKVMLKVMMKFCFILYIVIGWIGYVFKVCENIELYIFEKIGFFLWGWLNCFLN